MRRRQFAAVLLLAWPVVCWAGNYVVPTTTLQAQTANNTSAANNFPTQSNGNLGANDVSKADVQFVALFRRDDQGVRAPAALVRAIESHERWLQLDGSGANRTPDHRHDQPGYRRSDHRLVWAE